VIRAANRNGLTAASLLVAVSFCLAACSSAGAPDRLSIPSSDLARVVPLDVIPSDFSKAYEGPADPAKPMSEGLVTAFVSDGSRITLSFSIAVDAATAWRMLEQGAAALKGLQFGVADAPPASGGVVLRAPCDASARPPLLNACAGVGVASSGVGDSGAAFQSAVPLEGMDATAELVQMDRLVVYLLIEAKERPALLDLRASSSAASPNCYAARLLRGPTSGRRA
jgi:hypothetical protein